MTDITALAQREKFEAWAEERCALPWGYLKNRRTNTGYFSKHDYTSLWAAWKAAGAELVEALEKAQRTSGHLRDQSAEWERKAISNFEECARLSQLVEELESRTVKLPELCVGVVQEGHAVMVPYAAGHWFNKTAILEMLTAAGIKWEAE